MGELKKEAFWQCTDGQFVVKQGIELNLQILADTLKEKHNKYVKKIQQRQKVVPTLIPTSATNSIDVDGSGSHSLSEALSTSATTITRTVPSEAMTSQYVSSISTPPLSNDHIRTVERLIEKQSGKIFHSTILKYNEHYQLSFADRLKLSTKLKASKVYELNDLCSSVRNHFERTSNTFDLSGLDSDDDDLSDTSEQSTKDSDDEGESEKLDVDNDDEVDDNHEDEQKENEFSNVQSQDFKGMRIDDAINQSDSSKYFKITVNGREKFMHKQTAVWYLTNKNCHLSSDRLVRVQTTTAQEY